jgi:trk system potassium uptake protein TrkA
MKRFVVVGLGRFGSWVARALYEQGYEVIALELDEALVDRHAPAMTRGVVGDATDPDMLRRVGASDADAAVISTGEDLAATIMSVLALRDVGVKRIYAKVASLRAARALARFEVDEMIFPEKDSAERLSRRITSTTVLDYVSLGQDHAIQEMAIPDAWVGKTLRELALPRERGIQVVALFNVLETTWDVVPDPDEPLTESHVAIVAGEEKVLAELIREVDRGRS